MKSSALKLVMVSAMVIASAIAAEDVRNAPDPTPPYPTPIWAFPSPVAQTVPGSTRKFSEVLLFDRTRAVDWFPDEHPAMPAAVAGRAPVFACGYCHLPTGGGRPENAVLAGMTADYIRRQIADMKSGDRLHDPHFTTGANMLNTAKMSTQADIDAAAEYFASLAYRKHLKVIEATDVPRVRADAVYFFDRSGARESLGNRILEGPDDVQAFEKRDPNTTYTAFVPVGSLQRGAALVKGMGCEGCHGQKLNGSVIAPPLAGRFATGMFRQLYSFKLGYRNGPQTALMTPIVQSLSVDDMIALAAYAASLEPE